MQSKDRSGFSSREFYGLDILQTANSIEINKDVSSAYLSFNNTAVIIINLS
jgi:hypothetical protein